MATTRSKPPGAAKRADLLTERAVGPSVRELEALRAMIDNRKLIAAAARLGVTQSAVSRSIDALERKLGKPLFRREAGRLVPTLDAFALNNVASMLFEGLDRVARWPDVSAPLQDLRIATSPSFAQHLVPRLVSRFREVEPASLISVEILNGVQAVSAVAEGKVDLGIVDSSVVHAGVVAEPFRVSFVHALMLRDHPLARGGDISVRELRDTPLILQARRFAVRAELDRVFDRAGVVPRIVAEAVTAAFAADLMMHGVGVALVSPFPITLGLPPSVVARRLVPAIEQRSVLIFPATGPVSLAARRFADLLLAEHADDSHAATIG